MSNTNNPNDLPESGKAQSGANSGSKPGLTLLQEQAEEFNFYQAIRMLESVLKKQPEPAKLHFKAVNSQAFTPNFLADINRKVHEPVHSSTSANIQDQSQSQFQSQSQSHETVEVSVNGFGLGGLQGPLPDVFSELLQRESFEGNSGAEAFLNLFNHRVISLLYSIKKELDPMLFNDSPYENPGESRLLKAAAAMTGFSTLDVQERIPLRIDKLLSFVTLLIGNRQNYSSIKNIVETLFDCSVAINPCEGAWKKLPKRYQSRLGHRKTKLGSGIGLGEHYWDNQAGIGIVMQLKSLQTCYNLLPQGCWHQALTAILSLLTDGRYRVNVTLKLDWEAVPLSVLTKRRAMHLGSTSWLKETDSPRDDLTFPEFTVHPSLKNRLNGQAELASASDSAAGAY